MNVADIGIATLHTRVERWESDYNDHWNTRFYGRSFQHAAEVCAARFAEAGSDAGKPALRHIRFHRELFVSDTVEVRSAVLDDGGDMDGAVVHILASGGELSATALDPDGVGDRLPRVAAKDVPFALPRGVSGDTPEKWPGPDDLYSRVEIGPVRPRDVDHAGDLLFEELIRCGSIASSVQLHRLGFTPESSQRSRIAQMAVELRVTRINEPTVGSCLRGLSRISAVAKKSFRADHRIMTPDGNTVAILEFCLVPVDLDTRRAAPVPDLITEAWEKTQSAIRCE